MVEKHSTTRQLKTTLSIGAGALPLALFMTSVVAHAQAVPSDDDLEQTFEEDQAPAPAGEVSDEDNEIVVIGTGTNISGVAPVGGQAIVMDREDILATGKSTIADVVRTLPQLQATGSGGSQTFVETPTGGNSVNQANVVRGTSLNIRGIGQGATLLLVDGHRIAPAGTESSFAEANLVPISAVERVEVLTEGASAIYGSDAIAGVVNYILRKDFDGIEANARYTVGEYADSWAVGVTGGTHWALGGLGDGNVIATYEHSQQDPWFRGNNPRLRQDQRTFGGLDYRVNGNTASPALAGNIVIPSADPDGPGPATAPINPLFPRGQGNTYYGLPNNPTGAPLTVAQLSANNPNLVDRGDYEDFQPRVNRDQFSILLNQDFGPWLSFYNQFFYSDRDTVTRTFYSQNANANVSVTVPAILSNGQPNPNYIAGIPGLAPGAPIPVQMNLLERVAPNGPRFINETPERAFSNTAGFRALLGSDWTAELYYTYSQNKSCGVCFLGNFINADAGNALQAAVDSGLINPFSTEPFDESQLDAILGTNYQRSQNYANDVVAKVDGALFTLPGGELRVALGGEYYYGIQKLQNGASRGASVTVIPDADARNTRTQKAAFGELYVPLIGDEMDVPLVQELIVDAALRYDHYSDFGDTTNPRIGVNWVVSDTLRFRGNWGTAFRAPGLPELNGDVFSVVFNFPVFNNTGGAAYPGEVLVNTLFRIGGSEELTAETAETWSLGFDLTPEFINGFRFSGTYYNVRYDNRLFNDLLGRGFGYLSNAEAYGFVQSFVTDINNPAGCVDGDSATWDPTLAALAGPGTFLYGAVTTPCQIGSFFDARRTNASYTLQDGLDLSADYRFDLGAGRLNIGGSITKVLNNEEQLVSGDPVQQNLDTIGDPISFRGRANLTYSNGPFVGSIFMNHVGGYTNDQPIADDVVTGGTATNVVRPVHDIASWTTLDMSLALNFDADADWEPLRNLRISANVNNVLGSDPPIVHSTLFGSSSVDLLAHGIGQTTVQFQVTKRY